MYWDRAGPGQTGLDVGLGLRPDQAGKGKRAVEGRLRVRTDTVDAALGAEKYVVERWERWRLLVLGPPVPSPPTRSRVNGIQRACRDNLGLMDRPVVGDALYSTYII